MMLTLIVNPTAGNGYAQKVAEQLRTGVYPEFCVNVLRECKQQKLV